MKRLDGTGFQLARLSNDAFSPKGETVSQMTICGAAEAEGEIGKVAANASKRRRRCFAAFRFTGFMSWMLT